MSKKLFKVHHRVVIFKDFYVWSDDMEEAWDLVDKGYVHDLNEYEFDSSCGDIKWFPFAEELKLRDIDVLNPEDAPQEEDEDEADEDE